MGREASRSYLLGFSSAIAAERIGVGRRRIEMAGLLLHGEVMLQSERQHEELGSQYLVHDRWLTAQSLDEWRLALCCMHLGVLGAEISELGDISCFMAAWQQMPCGQLFEGDF